MIMMINKKPKILKRLKHKFKQYLQKFRTPRWACSQRVSVIFKKKVSNALIDGV